MNKSSSKNWEIESRLERSLRNQIRAPQLDGRFEAAVWAQIDKARDMAAAPALPPKSAAARWLFAINVVGVLVAIVLVGVFGLQAFTDSGMNVALPQVPQVPQGFVERAVMAMVWPVTILALGFGMMFTSVGRRLRAEIF